LRNLLTDALMWSCLIEILDIDTSRTMQLLLMKDQYVVQTLSPNTPQKSFTDRIGAFRMRRCFKYLDACAGYIARLFSKETVFTREFRGCHPSFPAFLPESPSPKEGHSYPDHDGISVCSPRTIRRVSRCVPSLPTIFIVWQRGQDPCLHHATSGVPPLQLPCL
jgi:hypothetical protein